MNTLGLQAVKQTSSSLKRRKSWIHRVFLPNSSLSRSQWPTACSHQCIRLSRDTSHQFFRNRSRQGFRTTSNTIKSSSSNVTTLPRQCRVLSSSWCRWISPWMKVCTSFSYTSTFPSPRSSLLYNMNITSISTLYNLRPNSSWNDTNPLEDDTRITNFDTSSTTAFRRH